MRRSLLVLLLHVLLIAACGTLEVTVDRTPTPDLGATFTIGTLLAKNAQLAAQVATLNPASMPLTMDSSSETIRQKLQASATLWDTVFVDGTVTWYPPEGTDAPPQIFHEQDWIDYPSHRFRVLLGPADGAAETFQACDGSTILEIDLKSGQSQASPLPKFAQEPALVPSQDVLWGQIGTPLAEIVLSSNYAAAAGVSGGIYEPVGIEKVAGRQTLVADWTRAGNSQHSYRAWVDVETGVILEFQEFGKGGGEALQGERLVNQVVYNADFPDFMFGSPTSPPQFSDIHGNPLTSTAPAPTPSSQADPLGQVYFFIFNHEYGNETTKLVRLPGSCVTDPSICPEPEEIQTPFSLNFSLTPLVWSPDGDVAALAYPISKDGNRAGLFLFDPLELSWNSLAEFNFIDPPMWSPDGDWLAFRVQDGQGGADIYAIRRDGTGLSNLTASSELSPEDRPYAADGWIKGSAILHSAGGNSYLVNPGNGTVRPLFKTLAIKSQLFPSPDGERFAYFEYSDDTPKRMLKTIDIEGAAVNELGVFQGGSIYPVVWSQDGAKVAFVHLVDPPGYQDVYVVNRDGTELSQVYRGTTVGTLAFSPEGGSLLIRDDNAAGQHIFTVNLTTLEQQMLQAPNLPLDWGWLAPSWRP
jgi:hypothetical protein